MPITSTAAAAPAATTATAAAKATTTVAAAATKTTTFYAHTAVWPTTVASGPTLERDSTK